MTRHTESQIQDLMTRFAEEVQTDTRPTTFAARTRPSGAPTAPSTGYRVAVAGIPVCDVLAAGIGEAVVMACDALPEIRGYVFLWDYTVTDSDGVTVRGDDPVMRDAVQTVRMARR